MCLFTHALEIVSLIQANVLRKAPQAPANEAMETRQTSAPLGGTGATAHQDEFAGQQTVSHSARKTQAIPILIYRPLHSRATPKGSQLMPRASSASVSLG
jgi:hypothetical protein